jgi:hypothetical protein
MKKLITGVIAVAILWSIWPFYALYDLTNSLNEGDQVGLERRIDWSSIRQGLREDLNALLVRNVTQEIDGQGSLGGAISAGLVAMIGPALVRKTLDAFATPQTIAALIAQSKTSAPSVKETGSGAPEQLKKDKVNLGMVKYAFFSRGPFDFRVEIEPGTRDNGAPLVLLFKWNGDWRLTRILASRKTFEAIARAHEQPGRLSAPFGLAWPNRLN